MQDPGIKMGKPVHPESNRKGGFFYEEADGNDESMFVLFPLYDRWRNGRSSISDSAVPSVHEEAGLKNQFSGVLRVN